MKIIHSVSQMKKFSNAVRAEGREIVIVPTMGSLHKGHLSLMGLKKKQDVLIATIFVNPTQFGEGEDYEIYPRQWKKDIELCKDSGVDCIFAPDAAEMYPEGFQTTINVTGITKNLCGISRPSHFAGVATIVAKLFAITKPHCAVFGEKDFQQLMVIKRMVRDLNFDVIIKGAPIVRESDGLAMSSRNKHLNSAERKAAQSLFNALCETKKMFDSGQRNSAVLIKHAGDIIRTEKTAKIDYVRICDPLTLKNITTISNDAVIALAVLFSKTRLIDNMVLKRGSDN